jgi:hypothetical protein
MVQIVSKRNELKPLKSELSALKAQYAELATDYKLTVKSLEYFYYAIVRYVFLKPYAAIVPNINSSFTYYLCE